MNENLNTTTHTTLLPGRKRCTAFVAFVAPEDHAQAYQRAANAEAGGNKSGWIKRQLDRAARGYFHPQRQKT